MNRFSLNISKISLNLASAWYPVYPSWYPPSRTTPGYTPPHVVTGPHAAAGRSPRVNMVVGLRSVAQLTSGVH